MVPMALLAMLCDVADRALGRLGLRAPAPPSFEGLLDELFARWPLDAVEYAERGEPMPLDRAA
jgi:hypothetical protein